MDIFYAWFIQISPPISPDDTLCQDSEQGAAQQLDRSALRTS